VAAPLSCGISRGRRVMVAIRIGWVDEG
jgi:hypothetical protein